MIQSRRVLLVDDEPLAVAGISRILERRGYAVSTASNGNEAYGLFEANGADLIITDLRMPGGSGGELIKAVRNLDGEVPIVVISAVPADGIRDSVSAAAISRILSKPVSVREVVSVVGDLIGHNDQIH